MDKNLSRLPEAAQDSAAGTYGRHRVRHVSSWTQSHTPAEDISFSHQSFPWSKRFKKSETEYGGGRLLTSEQSSTVWIDVWSLEPGIPRLKSQLTTYLLGGLGQVA